jgi:hypothetical protein
MTCKYGILALLSLLLINGCATSEGNGNNRGTFKPTTTVSTDTEVFSSDNFGCDARPSSSSVKVGQRFSLSILLGGMNGTITIGGLVERQTETQFTVDQVFELTGLTMARTFTRSYTGVSVERDVIKRFVCSYSVTVEP